MQQQQQQQPAWRRRRVLITAAEDGSVCGWCMHSADFGRQLFAAHPHTGGCDSACCVVGWLQCCWSRLMGASVLLLLLLLLLPSLSDQLSLYVPAM